MENVVIIVPSYNPDEKLVNTIKGLVATGFTDILVVNDGADPSHTAPFEEVKSFKECTIISHDVNKGKGRALKTAFEFCLKNRRGCSGVVTVDGDGQHHPEDVKNCAERMLKEKDKVVLGVRNFKDPSVPPKSKFGNTLTSFAFKSLCGIKLSDTQTGLRAIPFSFLESFIKIEGERYEYETNMLLEMKNFKIGFVEEVIRTIYLNENASSHFHPIRDSFKIYKIIFKFALSSGTSCLIDIGLFWLLSFIFERTGFTGIPSIYTATAGARIVSSIFNYKMNRNVVFAAGGKNSVYKYYALCIVQFAVSAGLVSLASFLLKEGSFLETLYKIVVDTLLFFISFRIQKHWVFKKDA
ncbi:MAG: bifunctional glycosyltransferase family 2/GtrA family protein [Lachnospiraceae bacterium]|nr:bifunctional glycosyltransferase family 2/GtrA family protein [Lachnospiraceae bacterium]